MRLRRTDKYFNRNNVNSGNRLRPVKKILQMLPLPQEIMSRKRGISTGVLQIIMSATIPVLLSVFFVMVSVSTAGAESRWPVNIDVDLSSGFGDYRFGHFHFGIDIRTGGVTGKDVVSPVDGYVWRVRTSYRGYGKALYIKGDDGYTYVFGHLHDFARPIDERLKEVQMIAKRYYQDLYFPEDSIRVKKGEFVAFSGQTGSGAPHLHFEKRYGDIPLNPLSHGYRLQDRVRPVFTRLGIHLVDDRSLFDDGSRRMWLPVRETGKAGEYKIDTALYFDTPVGLLADCYDMMRASGMKQSVYRVAVYVDGRLWHESRFDSAFFETNTSVSLEYDLLEASERRKHVRRLYRGVGNVYPGCRPNGDHNGLIGCTEELRPGVHEVRIVGEDAFENKSELRFDLLIGPGEELYALDSTVKVAPDTTDFYFTAHPDAKRFDMDSIVVYVGRADMWGWTPDATVEELDGGGLKVRAYGYRTAIVPLRLYMFAEEGVVIEGGVFNGILPDESGHKFEMAHEVVEDGLVIKVNSSEPLAFDSRVEFYYQDSLLGIEHGEMVTPKRYQFFVPPRPEYRRIDRYHVVLSHDPKYTGRWSDTLHLVIAGLAPEERIAFDDWVWLEMGEENFFKPMFLELKRYPIYDRGGLGLNSEHYRVLPETFPTRKNFRIVYDIPYDAETNSHSGLCWLDEDKDRFVWLDNRFDDDGDVLTATAGGGGSFATVFDYEAPKVSRLSIREGGVYQSHQPAINFIIEDTLSGIEDDRSIVIELDGQWLIPEYEPETGRVRSRPLQMLEGGEHHLGIMVTDRAGNKTEKYLRFRIQKTAKERGQ